MRWKVELEGWFFLAQEIGLLRLCLMIPSEALAEEAKQNAGKNVFSKIGSEFSGSDLVGFALIATVAVGIGGALYHGNKFVKEAAPSLQLYLNPDTEAGKLKIRLLESIDSQQKIRDLEFQALKEARDPSHPRTLDPLNVAAAYYYFHHSSWISEANAPASDLAEACRFGMQIANLEDADKSLLKGSAFQRASAVNALTPEKLRERLANDSFVVSDPP